MPELLLAEAEEEVRLVLAPVAPLAQHHLIRVMLDDGVVARGDVIRPERAGLLPEVAKFQLLVAHHARVRRAPGAVFAGKVINDELFELIRLVHDVVRNPDPMSHTPGVRNGGGAAALVLGTRNTVLRPDLHGHADDFISLLLEQMGGHTRVDPPAHPHKDAFAVSVHPGSIPRRKGASNVAGGAGLTKKGEV